MIYKNYFFRVKPTLNTSIDANITANSLIEAPSVASGDRKSHDVHSRPNYFSYKSDHAIGAEEKVKGNKCIEQGN